MKNKKRGLALLFVIFVILLFSLLGLMLASVSANRAAIARGFYRSDQIFYINDMGMERAKQKLSDDWSWRPPDPPGYLEEEVTINNLTALYKIYVQDSATEAGAVNIRVESVFQ